MQPDNATLYAWQRIYEPLPSVDNKWIVFYSLDDGWRQKSFITSDGAWMFYAQKVREYKQEFAERNKGR